MISTSCLAATYFNHFFKKISVLLLLVCLLPENTFSQNRVRETETHLDSTFETYGRAEYKLALNYANRALSSCEQISDSYKLSADSLREQTLSYKANIFLHLSRSDSATLMIEQMEENGFVTPTFRYRAYLYLLAALDDQERDKIRQAYYNALDALAALESTEEKKYIDFQKGNIKRTVGTSFLSLSEYDSALFYYEKALVHFERAEQKGDVLMTKYYLGSVLSESFKYKAAEKYFDEVIEQSPKSGASSDYGYLALGALLTMYTNQEVARKDILNRAVEVFDDFERNTESLFAKYELASDISGHARICGEFETALFFNRKSRQFAEKTADAEEFIMDADLHFAHIMNDMGRKREALKIYKTVLLTAQKLKISSTQKLALHAISELEESLGNYKEALAHYKKYHALESKVAEERLSELVTKHEIAFRTKEKEEENLLLKEQNKTKEAEISAKNNQNAALITGMAALFLLAGFIYRAQYKQRKSNTLLREKNDEIQLQSEALRQINEELHALHNFKESMTGMLAHDVKNPLNTILHFGKQNEIQRAGRYILRLMQNLLDVQKFEDASMTVNTKNLPFFPLGEQVKEHLKGALSQKSIMLETELPGSFGVKADAELLPRILENLLSNAVKFSPDGSRVLLSAERIEDKVHLKVEDSGQGISAADRNQIFEKFYQGEVRRSGLTTSSGLGLTFCKMAAEAQGGKIWAEESTALGGAAFVLELPAAEISAAGSVQASTSALGFGFTLQDNKTLKELCARLEGVEAYMISEVEELLMAFNLSSSALSAWGKQLRQAVLQGDEKRYIELLQLGKD